MRAITRDRYGGPEVLQPQSLPMPVPAANELLLKLSVAAVGRTDCHMLTAKPFLMRLVTGWLGPRQPIPGTAFAGRVEACGAAVTGFEVGDLVYGFDDSGASCLAEYCTYPANGAVAPAPQRVRAEAAVAAVEGGHYAINFLNKVTIEPGQSALVNGATGAIGSALVQLLHARQVEVVAVCRSQHAQAVLALGASSVIDYETTDFTATDQRFDLVLDAVGKSTFLRTRHLLKPQGTYMSSELAWLAQNLFYALATRLLPGRNVRFPTPLRPRKSLHILREMIDDGSFKAVIDRRYPLAEASEAYRYVMTGEKFGNVVLNIDPI